MGTYQFGVTFRFTPRDIPDAKRKNIATEIHIPKDFRVINMPQIFGMTFSRRANADGTTTVIGKADASVTDSMIGQLLVQQNAKNLINGLKESEGEYPFRMQMFVNYGEETQEVVVTTGATDEIDSFILKGDVTTPEFTVTPLTNKNEWYPDDIYSKSSGRRNQNIAGANTSAAYDALHMMGGFKAHDSAFQGGTSAHFAVEFKKSSGYLPDGTIFDLVLPKEDEQPENRIFEEKGIIEVLYRTESGHEITRTYNTWNSTSGALGNDVGRHTLNGAAEAERNNTKDYISPVAGYTGSYADFYHEAGTLTIYYMSAVYYNRLYQGDWTKTTYTAEKGSTVKYTGHDGMVNQKEGDPLVFNYIQGTAKTTFTSTYTDFRYVAGQDALLTQMPQYSSSNPNYHDTELLNPVYTFNSGHFKIQNNFALSYDFEEELSPVYFGNLRTSKKYGFTYRIFIKDAKTGKVDRIITLVDEEAWEKGYIAKTIDGVVETPVNASEMKDWTFTDADQGGNTNYISRLEVTKDILGYNLVGAPDGISFFTTKFRAYHHRLSDGTDIPDAYSASIQRAMTSKQIQEDYGASLSRKMTVKTVHLKDTLTLVNPTYLNNMEVNDHPEAGPLINFVVRKFADTMDYNLDADGKLIPFGNENYDPVVIEISGDAVGLIDRVDRKTQRLLGVWGNDDKYYDLTEKGVDPEKFLNDAISTYKDGFETVNLNPGHQYLGQFDYSGQLYNLNSIFDELGIKYAKKLVVAYDNVNNWKPKHDSEQQPLYAFAKKVHPGYLNYDAVVGSNGSADLPKRLPYKVALYCQYSDYKAEIVNGGEALDHNGGTAHGTKKAISWQSARLVEGVMVRSINVFTNDHVVNPYSAAVSDGRGRLVNNQAGFVSNTIGEPENSALELTRINVTTPFQNLEDASTVAQNPAIQYKNTSLDFKGTDPKLLSLANTVSFNQRGWTQAWNFNLVYTLNTGEEKTIDVLALKEAGAYSSGRIHYLIPGVDPANGVYLTSLKVTFPDHLNWGWNSNKLASISSLNQYIPSVGLGAFNYIFPVNYPGTDVAIGSVEDHEKEAEFDKLTVKAALHFENIFGETKTEAETYKTVGVSNRIQGQKITISRLRNSVQTYSPASSFQGQTIQNVRTQVSYQPTADTEILLRVSGRKLRPVYYIQIDKDFTYVDHSVSGVPEGADVSFVPAGTGEGQSGNLKYGYLVISYLNVPEEKVNTTRSSTIVDGRWTDLYLNDFNYKLNVRYSANPGDKVVVSGVWLDFPLESGRSGQDDGDILTDTGNQHNQLLDSAPTGAALGNLDVIKDQNNDGMAEMLFVEVQNTYRILKQAIQGIVSYVVATHPYEESTKQVTSRDLTSVENLFSGRVYIAGDETLDTFDWEIYLPIPKKGEQYAYHRENTDLLSEKNQYSLSFLGVDTKDLDEKTLNYKVLYTTDKNPAAGGYGTVKEAAWIDTGHWEKDLPDDLNTVTMIKIMVEEMKFKELTFFDLKMKMTEHKSDIGLLKNQTVSYANYMLREGETSKYAYGEKGQSTIPASYFLEDMHVSGHVWEEEDYNSTYNLNIDQNVSGIQMELLNVNNNVVHKVDSDTLGNYTLTMPHDGEWTVHATIPEGKRAVNRKVNNDPTIDSAFNRETNLVTFDYKADPIKRLYEQKNVRLGFYTLPVISFNQRPLFVHVGETGTITAKVDKIVGGEGAGVVTFEDPEDKKIATLEDADGKINGENSGQTVGTASTPDGYGGTVTASYAVTSFARVIYDLNGGLGTAPVDDAIYYPSLDADDIDAQTDKVTVKTNEGVIPPTGYIFAEWNTAKDGNGTPHKGDATFAMGSVGEDIQLYAIYEANRYMVEFNSNGGTGQMADQEFVYDAAKSLIKNEFKRPDFNFLGWSTDQDATKAEYADEQEVKNLTDEKDGKIKLYAVWAELPNIQYIYESADVNMGTVSPASEAIKPDTGKPEGAEAIPSEGHHFVKWTDESGDVISEESQFSPERSSEDTGKTRRFTAHFAPNMYTVRFIDHDGKLIKEEQVSYGKTATAPQDPTRQDYRFTAWDKPFDNVVEDMEIKAVYEKLPQETSPSPSPSPSSSPSPSPSPSPNPSQSTNSNKAPRTGEQVTIRFIIPILLVLSAYVLWKLRKRSKQAR